MGIGLYALMQDMIRLILVVRVHGKLEWNRDNPESILYQAVVHLESDALGSQVCGAAWGSHWLQWKWNLTAQQWDISLLPILLVGVV